MGTSILKGKDGKYHLFYSRWKKEYKFTVTHSEIAQATSKSPSGPWKFKETVLKGRGKEHWDAITAHNPKIKYFEGKYWMPAMSDAPQCGYNGRHEWFWEPGFISN